MGYHVVLRRNGAKVGHFGPFTTKKQAIAQGQVLADDAARDVVVSVEPQRKKATTKRKNTRRRTKKRFPATPLGAHEFASAVAKELAGMLGGIQNKRVANRVELPNGQHVSLISGVGGRPGDQYVFARVKTYGANSFVEGHGHTTHGISTGITVESPEGSPLELARKIKDALHARHKRGVSGGVTRTNTRRTRKNAHPRTEAEIRADHRVKSLHKERDGFCDKTRLVDGRYRTIKKPAWWLYLKSGWISPYMESGTIHECTLKEVAAHLAGVVREEEYYRTNPSRGKFRAQNYKYYRTSTRGGNHIVDGRNSLKGLNAAQKKTYKTAAQAKKTIGYSLTSSYAWMTDKERQKANKEATKRRRKLRSNKSKPWITREGKLGGPGYTERPARTRHMLLNRSVKGYGYRSTLGSLQVLLLNSHMGNKDRKVIEADKKWLMKKYGGKGSFSKSRR